MKLKEMFLGIFKKFWRFKKVELIKEDNRGRRIFIEGINFRRKGPFLIDFNGTKWWYQEPMLLKREDNKPIHISSSVRGTHFLYSLSSGNRLSIYFSEGKCTKLMI